MYFEFGICQFRSSGLLLVVGELQAYMKISFASGPSTIPHSTLRCSLGYTDPVLNQIPAAGSEVK